MTELENLARKAVEATKAYETFTSEKNVTSMLQAIAAFRAVVTPEDWLKQTETVEKAEREQITAVDSMLRTEQDIGTIATRLMKAEAENIRLALELKKAFNKEEDYVNQIENS